MNTVAIIGNGIAGATAALKLRQKNKSVRIVMISGESRFHYSRPALMYIFMGHMKFSDTMPYPEHYWDEQNIELVHDWVETIETKDQKLRTRSGLTIAYDKLILATGSQSNKFGWPGQDLEGVQGFYSVQDLTKLEESVRRAKNAVIVGGGLIGIELGEMLHTRGINVTFLIREKSYWNSVLPYEESAMINRIIKAEHMNIIPETNLKAILGDNSGRAKAIVTEKDEEIPCEIVGLTPGVHPNIDLVKETEITTAKGIIVNSYLETTVENIYACGDCAEIKLADGTSKIEPLWYAGKMQAEQLIENMTGEKKEYSYGTYYNSAKFLDLEYQVYGTVEKNNSEDKHYFWKSTDEKQSLRLVERDGVLVGVNVMGMRYRHRVCEEWIDNKITISETLSKLREANFNPEFSKKYEKEIVNQFRGEL